MKKAYPILEFDPDRAALIEPGDGYEAADLPEACVVCFFQDVIERLQGEGQAQVITHLVNEIGQFPVFAVEARGWRFALSMPARVASGLPRKRAPNSESSGGSHMHLSGALTHLRNFPFPERP